MLRSPVEENLYPARPGEVSGPSSPRLPIQGSLPPPLFALPDGDGFLVEGFPGFDFRDERFEPGSPVNPRGRLS